MPAALFSCSGARKKARNTDDQGSDVCADELISSALLRSGSRGDEMEQMKPSTASLCSSDVVRFKLLVLNRHSVEPMEAG